MTAIETIKRFIEIGPPDGMYWPINPPTEYFEKKLGGLVSILKEILVKEVI